MTIMQGDQVLVALTLTNDEGDIITDYGVEEVVVTIGSIEVKMTDGDVAYDSEEEVWMFPILQEQSLAQAAGMERMQVRVKFSDGSVCGANVATVFILPAKNTEVL